MQLAQLAQAEIELMDDLILENAAKINSGFYNCHEREKS